MNLPGNIATPMTIGGIVGAALGFPLGGVTGSVRYGIGGTLVGMLIGIGKGLDPDNPDVAVPEIWQRDTRQTPFWDARKQAVDPGLLAEDRRGDYKIDLSQFEGWGDIPIADAGEIYNPRSRTTLADVTTMGWDANLGMTSLEANMTNFLAVTPTDQDDLIVIFEWMAFLAYNMKRMNTDGGGDHGVSVVRADSTVERYRRQLLACGDDRLSQDEAYGDPSEMVCGLRIIRAMVRAVEDGAQIDAVVRRIAANYYNNVEKPLKGQATATRYVPASLVGAIAPSRSSSSTSSSSSSSSSDSAASVATESNPESRLPLWDRRGVKIGAGVVGGALLITIIAMAASGGRRRR